MREPLTVFWLALALGLAGAAPTVTFGDAGEFAACAAILGLAHAPDYPLYALLGKAFGAALPLGNWAYRTNALSAVCAAAALALLAAALRRCGFSLLARGVAVAAVGLSPLWRYESGVTEVFAPHLLALCALLWIACRYSGRAWDMRPAAAAGLALGLGAGNHQTIALAAPALLAQAWAQGRPSFTRGARAIGIAAAFFALGFSVYLFLPVRSARRPPLNWGQPTTAARFWHAVLRKDYGTLSLTVEGQARGDGGRLASQTARWARASAEHLSWPVLILAALGAWAWPAAAAVSRWLPLAWALGCGPFFLWLGNPPFDAQTSYALERFYLASWLGLAPLAAAGVDRLRRAAPALGWLAAAAALSTAAQPSAWGRWWARGDLASYDYGRSILRSLPRGATLFMDGGDDTFYSLAFLRYAQGLRPDLALHDRGGLVFPGAYGEGFRSLPRQAKEPARREIEIPLAREGRLFYSTINDNVLQGFSLEPWGLLRRPAGPPGRPPAPALWSVYPLRFERALLAAHYRDRALVAVYPFSRAVSRARAGDLEGAYADLALTLSIGADALWTPSNVGYAAAMAGYEAVKQGRFEVAGKLYGLWAAAAPGQAEPLLNLGVVAEKSGKPDEAQRLYTRARALEPASARASYNLGALYWSRGNWGEAALAFEEASRLSPGDPASAKFAAQARLRQRHATPPKR